ncbi:MAG: CotH kinase family protein [Thermoanaerobaculia bacterium]
MSRRPARRKAFATTVVAALFVLALVLAGGTPVGRSLAAPLTRSTAPPRAIGSPRLRAALVERGILHLQPPAGEGAGDCPEIELATRPPAPDTVPSTNVAPPEARESREPFVSLWLDPCRLARLHATPWKRGRETEEVGWVSIFAGGSILLESAVGVRIHGGISRHEPPFSYRLYFRREYGSPGVPGELLAPDLDLPVARLVLAELDDRDRDGSLWYLPGVAALEVGRRLGAATPAARPVHFSLGGGDPHLVLASERIDSDYLTRHYGHPEFDLVRGKREGNDSADELFRDELDWIADRPAPLTAAVAATRYDLDSLLSWLVSVVVCGTGDLYQDALVRDRTGLVRDGRWFWIHWDHDMSFRTPPRNSRFGRFEDAFPYIVWSGREWDVAPARALLVRLLTEDPSFRARVADRFEQAFRSELTPAFFAALVDRQEDEARRMGFADLHFAGQLRSFFAGRPEALRPQIAEVLRAAGDPGTTRPPGLVRRRGRSASVDP